MWNAPKLALQPRFGIAYRLNDKTAVRFGYALYTVPTEYNFTPAPVSGFEDVNFLEPPFFGMTGYQNTAPLLNGIPQATFSNPFPASNPLVPIAGKAPVRMSAAAGRRCCGIRRISRRRTTIA